MSKKHIPSILFSKQSNRKLLPNDISVLDLEKNIPAEEYSNNLCVDKRVLGIIPMEKQISRKNPLKKIRLTDYDLNYNLVLPKIPIKVNYQKEMMTTPHKPKHRLTVFKEFLYNKHNRNKSMMHKKHYNNNQN